jgi:deoxyribodipyrimidine photo-lyase
MTSLNLNHGEPVAIFWFRRDLRLDDNHGLFRALSDFEQVLPVFIFDSDILDELEPNDRRVVFIHQALQKIQEELLKKGSSLHVFHGKPETIFKQLITDLDISTVYTNHDFEPYAIQRDRNIQKLLKSKGIAFKTFKDHVVFEKDEIVKADGKPYTIYTPYSKRWLEKLEQERIPKFQSEKLTVRFLKCKPVEIPSLTSIGFKEQQFEFPSPQPELEIVQHYDQNRDFPTDNSTTKIGVHLRFGTISTRKMVCIGKLNNAVWLKQLIWREFFIQIMFHFPHVVTSSFRPEYDRINWENNEAHFEAWCNGKTGYPMVDAGMRELKTTGYMHNRARMVVASFLAKHLLIDWRWGEAWFAQHLLDFDLASNNGSWQWAAGTGCDAAPYFRVFNPALQAERFDPENNYIKKWVPEFQDPFTYPKPIVEHTFGRDRAIKRFSEAVKNISVS